MRRPTEHELTHAVQRVLWLSDNHPNPSAVMGRNIAPMTAKVVASLNTLLDELERRDAPR